MSRYRWSSVFAITITCALHSSPLLAQDENTAVESFSGIDANALPAPTTSGTFSSLQPAQSTAPQTAVAGFRTSFLHRPVSLTLPSPSPDGTVSNAVEGVVLLQAMASAGLGHGFDAGLAVSAHAYQWGSGFSAATTGPTLENFAVGDPRLSLGWSTTVQGLHLRPHLTLFLPAGDVDAFASEAGMRAEPGVALAIRPEHFVLQADVAFRLREVSTFGQTRWGPQLRLGLGGSYEFVNDWWLAAEWQLMPTLYSQPDPLLSEGGYLLPSEMLASVNYRKNPWSIRLGAGTGIPLTRPSTVSPDQSLVRGVTSPTLRALLEARLSF